MSVAFVKEESAEAASETQLPERPISPFPNLVTPAGLGALELQYQAAIEAEELASKIEDLNERRRQSALAARDARYFAERLRSAKVIDSSNGTDTVGFGSTVTFRRADDRVETYRIVGEDEANPTSGTLSHSAPIARLLMGKSVGDVIEMGKQEIEIVALT